MGIFYHALVEATSNYFGEGSLRDNDLQVNDEHGDDLEEKEKRGIIEEEVEKKNDVEEEKRGEVD